MSSARDAYMHAGVGACPSRNFGRASSQGEARMSGSGGSDSTAGFRYQHLVTIEALLDEFDANPEGDWLVGVDLRGQDSADFVVVPTPGGEPQRAVQVKASSPTSSTQLTLPSVISILSALFVEHPHSAQYEIRTNRRLTGPASRVEASLRGGKPVDGLNPSRARLSILRVAEDETVESLSACLRVRVLKYRAGVHAEVAGNITQLVISRMRDLVDEKASSAQDQYITAQMVPRTSRRPEPQRAEQHGLVVGARWRLEGRREDAPLTPLVGVRGDVFVHPLDELGGEVERDAELLRDRPGLECAVRRELREALASAILHHEVCTCDDVTCAEAERGRWHVINLSIGSSWRENHASGRHHVESERARPACLSHPEPAA